MATSERDEMGAPAGPVTIYLGLGANLGDRAAAVRAALDGLAARGLAIGAVSPFYETDAVTPDPQPTYLNAAARAQTTLSPRALLSACLDVERALGRRRPAGRVQAPREIDVDLLLYGEAIVDEPPTLVIPHPRLLDRPFVRVPLADVALPGLCHPRTGEALDRAPPDPGVRLAG